jgi:N-acyl-phosphatidylethanolamine-hydrolysing phospholipase D
MGLPPQSASLKSRSSRSRLHQSTQGHLNPYRLYRQYMHLKVSCLSSTHKAFPLEPLHSMPPQTPRPSHWSNDAGTSFRNPWPSAQAPTWSEMVSGGGLVGWAKREDQLVEHDKSREIKVVEPDWGMGRGATARSGRGDRENGKEAKIVAEQQGKGLLLGTWLGHAGAFVEIPLERGKDGQARSAKLLFDPIFSGTAGPAACTGPKRYRKSPCEVDDLPGCDCVFISHNQ